jgi:hypothetical protein
MHLFLHFTMDGEMSAVEQERICTSGKINADSEGTRRGSDWGALSFGSFSLGKQRK